MITEILISATQQPERLVYTDRKSAQAARRRFYTALQSLKMKDQIEITGFKSSGESGEWEFTIRPKGWSVINNLRKRETLSDGDRLAGGNDAEELRKLLEASDNEPDMDYWIQRGLNSGTENITQTEEKANVKSEDSHGSDGKE